jgi:hypothetical protein
MDLEQLNYIICIQNLEEAIEYLEFCRKRFEQALENIKELRENINGSN